MNNFGFSKQITLLFSAFIVFLLITTLISSFILNNHNTTDSTLFVLVLQNILVFTLPAILIGIFNNLKSPIGWLRLSTAPKPMHLLLAIAILFCSIPAANWIIYFNEHITFPESLHEFETALHQMEDTANDLTTGIVANCSATKLILVIAVIALLTGFAEELFFRGALLQIFTNHKVNIHLSIWFVAIVFSTLHFQFFGFIPRMLLGALFGYLLIYSGSLWVPITIHFLNNTIAIISTHGTHNGYLSQSIESIGSPENCEWLSLISIAAVAVLFAVLYKHRIR